MCSKCNYYAAEGRRCRVAECVLEIYWVCVMWPQKQNIWLTWVTKSPETAMDITEMESKPTDRDCEEHIYQLALCSHLESCRNYSAEGFLRGFFLFCFFEWWNWSCLEQNGKKYWKKQHISTRARQWTVGSANVFLLWSVTFPSLVPYPLSLSVFVSHSLVIFVLSLIPIWSFV